MSLLSTARLCDSKVTSWSVVGSVANLTIEMYAGALSSELSAILLLMRTSIELA